MELEERDRLNMATTRIENVFVKENASSIPSPSIQPIPDFSQFKGVMDTTKPIIAGHSFGGATTLLTLAEDTRFKAGIALDAWLFPVKDMSLSDTVKQPILFINTEKNKDRGENDR